MRNDETHKYIRNVSKILNIQRTSIINEEMFKVQLLENEMKIKNTEPCGIL